MSDKIKLKNQLMKVTQISKIDLYQSIFWGLCLLFVLLGTVLNKPWANIGVTLVCVGWAAGKITNQAVNAIVMLRFLNTLEKNEEDEQPPDQK